MKRLTALALVLTCSTAWAEPAPTFGPIYGMMLEQEMQVAVSIGQAREIIEGTITKPSTEQADAAEVMLGAFYRHGSIVECERPKGFGCDVAIGWHALEMITTGYRIYAFGRWSGASAIGASRSILLGDCTALPDPNAAGFVNIDNRLCFWRDTAEQVACPPPEPGCARPVS